MEERSLTPSERKRLKWGVTLQWKTAVRQNHSVWLPFSDACQNFPVYFYHLKEPYLY